MSDNMSDTFDKIKEIVVEQLDVDPDLVTMEANFEKDFKADSLDVVELVMKFETEFDIDIDDQEASAIESVQDAANYIEKYRTP
jgi:acyl carrier protein|tara:strand:+ start:105 stop:356 length:252 start_codon:yes stop_codon:yes gene_type:complete